GFSTSDASFGKYSGPAEYAGALFMILSAMPYIRFVQMIRGQARPMLRDKQVHAFLRWVFYAVMLVFLYRLFTQGGNVEELFRTSLFNIVSIFTGTGFGSANVANWGDFVLIVAFVAGLIGGCSSSSSGAFTVFRTIIVGKAILAQLQKVHSPNRMAPIRYDGVVVETDVINQVVMYLTGYILTIMVGSILISLTGVDIESALLGVWTSIGNIGFVFGPMTEQTGTMQAFPIFAKWVLITTMLLGRLGLLAVFVVVMPRFWRA
ncbi:TrkH family potassium uptake protein, partial [Thioclava sp. BHET1]